MSVFNKQMEAIGSALLLVARLPADAVWALEVTNDDDAESPTVLNIFAEGSEWAKLAMSLRLGYSIDHSTGEKGDQFISYRQGTLLVSFIEQEKK